LLNLTIERANKKAFALRAYERIEQHRLDPRSVTRS
jgi:hypothetical protein